MLAGRPVTQVTFVYLVKRKVTKKDDTSAKKILGDSGNELGDDLLKE